MQRECGTRRDLPKRSVQEGSLLIHRSRPPMARLGTGCWWLQRECLNAGSWFVERGEWRTTLLLRALRERPHGLFPPPGQKEQRRGIPSAFTAIPAYGWWCRPLRVPLERTHSSAGCGDGCLCSAAELDRWDRNRMLLIHTGIPRLLLTATRRAGFLRLHLSLSQHKQWRRVDMTTGPSGGSLTASQSPARV